MAKTLGQLYETGTALHYTAPSSRLVSNRNIGIELEYEGMSRDIEIFIDHNLWNVTEDGSLRTTSEDTYSRELRFAKPLAGIAVDHALADLAKNLNKERGNLVSPRTGLHVHIDIRDFSKDNLRNLTIVYLLVEPLLYRYCAESRDLNIFCIPLYKTHGYLNRNFSLASFRTNNYLQSSLSRARKYSGFNYASITTKGSVEFRMHKSITNVDKIYDWVNILLRIVEFGFSNKINLRRFIRHAELGGRDLITSIFKETVSLLNLTHLEDDIDTGLSSLFSIMNSPEMNADVKAITNKSIAQTSSDRAIVNQNPILDRVPPDDWMRMPSSEGASVQVNIDPPTTTSVTTSTTTTVLNARESMRALYSSGVARYGYNSISEDVNEE